MNLNSDISEAVSSATTLSILATVEAKKQMYWFLLYNIQ